MFERRIAESLRRRKTQSMMEASNAIDTSGWKDDTYDKSTGVVKFTDVTGKQQELKIGDHFEAELTGGGSKFRGILGWAGISEDGRGRKYVRFDGKRLTKKGTKSSQGFEFSPVTYKVTKLEKPE